MESKFLEGDKDEWFYHSLERYRNLYMFELEFPVDAIEVINEINFCLSGIQNFSKKCEILQLSIPPKLLPKDVEEGLCKDRDFNIISGGYSSARILQIKPIPAVENLVGTTQVGVNGVTLFQLGDDEHALIKEKCTLDLPEPLGAGVIDGQGSHLIATGTNGDTLYEWTLDPSSGTFPLLSHKIQKNQGRITKVKYWDENAVSFCTESGAVSLYDTRSDSLTLELTARKSAETLGIQYSHDTIPSKHIIGVVDSCGGYETFDIRGTTPESARVFLPSCVNSDEVLAGKFNVQYDPQAFSQDTSDFIVTGIKEDAVQIYRDTGTAVTPLFVHNGHSKVVTHALWHPTSDKLLLSCSIDAVLHAWQYQVQPNTTRDVANSEEHTATAGAANLQITH